jgi:hypothetical protein
MDRWTEEEEEESNEGGGSDLEASGDETDGIAILHRDYKWG